MVTTEQLLKAKEKFQNQFSKVVNNMRNRSKVSDEKYHADWKELQREMRILGEYGIEYSLWAKEVYDNL